jgi:ABC-type polysaccharide transport system permease subunit
MTGKRTKNDIFAVLLVCIAALAAVLPALYTFVLAWKDYSPLQGLSGSHWVGTANFRKLFANPVFPQLLWNSLRLWLVGTVGAGALGLLIAQLAALIRDRRRLALCAGLLLIPAFLPPAVWMTLLTRYIGPALLQNAAAFDLAYLLTAGLPICACLSPDFETLYLTYNPLVYEKADTFSTYAFRMGLQNGDLSAAAAASVTAMLLQAVVAVVACGLLYLLLQKRPDASAMPEPPSGTSRLPWVTCGALAVGFSLLCGLPGDLTRTLPALTSALPALMGLAAAFCVLYAASDGKNPAWVIFAGIALAASGMLSGQYLLLRSAGLINTVFATGLTTWLTPAALVFVLTLAWVTCSSRGAVPWLLGTTACWLAAAGLGRLFPGIAMTMSGAGNLARMLTDLAHFGNAADAYLPLTAVSLVLGFAGAWCAYRAVRKV